MAASGPIERREERVALGLDDDAAVRLDRVAQQRVVPRDDRRPAVVEPTACSRRVEPSMSVNRKVTSRTDGKRHRRRRPRSPSAPRDALGIPLPRRGVRVVDGAALESGQRELAWVRIPPSPPLRGFDDPPEPPSGSLFPAERSPSGLGRRTGNAVWGNPSRVQIPPSPPDPRGDGSQAHRLAARRGSRRAASPRHPGGSEQAA